MVLQLIIIIKFPPRPNCEKAIYFHMQCFTLVCSYTTHVAIKIFKFLCELFWVFYHNVTMFVDEIRESVKDPDITYLLNGVFWGKSFTQK